MASRQTPSQTVGPFFALGLAPREHGYEHASIAGPSTTAPDTPGEHIRVTGRVLDGDGNAVTDALIEVWQADARGRYRPAAGDGGDEPADPRFRGFARCSTEINDDHSFELRTIKPGPAGGQAPHLNLIVLMRGGLNHVYTRVYFDDEAGANAADPVLGSVPERRRGTLVAERRETASGAVYHFDIHMQGERETVFFDV